MNPKEENKLGVTTGEGGELTVLPNQNFPIPDCIKRGFEIRKIDPFVAEDLTTMFHELGSEGVREYLRKCDRAAHVAGKGPTHYFMVLDLARIPEKKRDGIGKLLKAWQEYPPVDGSVFRGALIGTKEELRHVDDNVYASGVGRIEREKST